MKRLISVCLSLLLVLGLVPSTALAVDYAKDQDRDTTYIALNASGTYQVQYFYDDDYFRASAYDYNPSLSTMSLIMALAATDVSSDPDYQGGSKNIEQLFSDVGMEHIKANEWYGQKPSTDSIALTCGSKKIDDFTLVAIAVRGGGYGSEWSSNFTMGLSGNHEGFQKAADDALKFTNDFISENNITGKVKFWMSGYSRGAATANLIGGALDDGYTFDADINYDLDGVFSYCFETPCGTLKATNDAAIEIVDKVSTSKYYNIFNITNPNDIVTYVAPTADGFGFGRYGLDVYLPSPESSPDYYELRLRMLNIYSSLLFYEDYIIDNFDSSRLQFDFNSIDFFGNDQDASATEMNLFCDAPNYMSQRMFFKQFLDNMANNYVGDRSNYVASLQTELRTMFAIMLGATPDQTAKFSESLQKSLSENFMDVLLVYFAQQGSLGFLGGSAAERDTIGDIMVQAVNDAGIDGYDEATIRSMGNEFLDIVMYLIFNSPDDLGTLTKNIEGLAQAHDAALCLSWLESMDSNYFYAVLNHTNNGDFRVIKIYGDSNFAVKDSTGKIVAQFANQQPIYLSDSAYRYGMDGVQMCVLLPVSESYTVEMDTKGDVAVVIAEYSAFANKYTRIINYQGNISSITMPAYTEQEIQNFTPKGSNANYKYQCSGMVFVNDYYGDYIDKGYVTLSVISGSRLGGQAYGSGVYFRGETVSLSGYANRGYTFDNWEVGSTEVSSDVNLEYTLTKDTEIVANYKFGGLKCDHSTSVLKDYKSATCENAGYTGDYYCTACGELIEQGREITALSHDFRDGFCMHCQVVSDDYVALTEYELFDAEQEALDAWIEEQRALAEMEEPEEEIEETEVVQEEEIEEKDKDSNSKHKAKDNTLIYVISGVAAAVVVAGGVGAFVIVKKRKKKQ